MRLLVVIGAGLLALLVGLIVIIIQVNRHDEQADLAADAESARQFDLRQERKHRAIAHCLVELHGEPVMGFDYEVVCVQPLKEPNR